LRQINLENSNFSQAMILVQTTAKQMTERDFQGAISSLQQAVTLSPSFTEAQYQLAVALRQAGQPDNSESALRRVLRLNPDHAPAHLLLGLVLRDQHHPPEASLELRKALQLAPGLAEAHGALGALASEARDWAVAVREFQSVLLWKPSDAAAHYGIAQAFKAQGRIEEADRELKIARELDPALPRSR
jgi:tetratricopeptide (TPR) repeat protein